MLESILVVLIVSEVAISFLICVLIHLLLLQNRYKVSDWAITALVSLGSVMPHNSISLLLSYWLVMLVSYWVGWLDVMSASIVAILLITFYQSKVLKEFNDMWRT